MENRSTGLMTLGQIGLGSIAGIILISAGYLFTNNLFLQVIIGDRIQHGFWIGFFTLAAFLLTYGLGVVGVAYGVKRVAQQFGQDCNLRHVWQGAFLGPPTLAVLIMITKLDWQTLIESMSGVGSLQYQSKFGFHTLFHLLILVIRPIASFLSLPVHLLLKIGLPPELLYTVSAPVGGILGYRFDWHRADEKSTESELIS